MKTTRSLRLNLPEKLHRQIKAKSALAGVGIIAWSIAALKKEAWKLTSRISKTKVTKNREAIIKLLKTGAIYKEIAQKLNVSIPYIASVNTTYNIDNRQAGRPADHKRIDEIRRMKERGMTYQAIANHYGVTRQCIQRSIKIKTPKQLTCPKCGSRSKRMDGHHTNYLDDSHKWLCQACHRRAHRKKSITVNKNC